MLIQLPQPIKGCEMSQRAEFSGNEALDLVLRGRHRDPQLVEVLRRKVAERLSFLPTKDRGCRRRESEPSSDAHGPRAAFALVLSFEVRPRAEARASARCSIAS